jgi:hypothetical protein
MLKAKSHEVEVILRATVRLCLGIEYPCGTCDQILLPVGMLLSISKSESLYGWQSVSQSVSMSWCRVHFVDVWPDIASFSSVGIWNLLSCLLGRPLWREADSVLCKSQSSHLSICTFTIYIFVFHTFTIYIYIYIYIHYTIHIIHTRLRLVPARYSRLCPTTH